MPDEIDRLRYAIMMDEFDEGMDPVSQEGSGSKLALVAVVVAVVAVVVGVTGIILANMAQKEIRTLEAKLASQPDKTPELETAVNDMEERLVKLGSEFVKLGRQDRQLQENTQSAFDSVLRDIKSNRTGINDLTGKLEDLVEKLENWQPARPTASATIPATDSSPESIEADDASTDSGVHVIQSGDTLSKIAKQYGLSLSELQRANPTVNPRALQIGQRILIPNQ